MDHFNSLKFTSERRKVVWIKWNTYYTHSKFLQYLEMLGLLYFSNNFLLLQLILPDSPYTFHYLWTELFLVYTYRNASEEELVLMFVSALLENFLYCGQYYDCTKLYPVLFTPLWVYYYIKPSAIYCSWLTMSTTICMCRHEH